MENIARTYKGEIMQTIINQNKTTTLAKEITAAASAFFHMTMPGTLYTQWHGNLPEVHNKTYSLPFSLQRVAAFLLLIIFSPILLSAIIAIKLESRGNAIFSQVRVGEQGRRFKLYKLRSMYSINDPKYVDPTNLKSDRKGICQKFFNDPRITPVGRIIRKLSIDELPQLFNVLKGDMALIGPRPALIMEVDKYSMHMMKRLQTKPGLTGLWQISGRADTTFEEQIHLDVKYVQQQSFWLDLKIMLMTIPVVLTGRGAY